eukprot:1154215-Pelagomonas_calceolata.AAC.4
MRNQPDVEVTTIQEIKGKQDELANAPCTCCTFYWPQRIPGMPEIPGISGWNVPMKCAYECDV